MYNIMPHVLCPPSCAQEWWLSMIVSCTSCTRSCNMCSARQVVCMNVDWVRRPVANRWCQDNALFSRLATLLSLQDSSTLQHWLPTLCLLSLMAGWLILLIIKLINICSWRYECQFGLAFWCCCDEQMYGLKPTVQWYLYMLTTASHLNSLTVIYAKLTDGTNERRPACYLSMPLDMTAAVAAWGGYLKSEVSAPLSVPVVDWWTLKRTIVCATVKCLILMCTLKAHSVD